MTTMRTLLTDDINIDADPLAAAAARRQHEEQSRPADLQIIGTDQDDQLAGRIGNDTLRGREGDDRLSGYGGDDLVTGGSGSDTLRGNTGDDVLHGWGGDDVLVGGRGDDRLFGGVGRDQFAFDPSRDGEGRDVVGDFRLGADKIVLDVDDVLASDPRLADAIVAGGATVQAVFDALDDSRGFNLRAAPDGDLVIRHPNGSIRLDGVDGTGVTSFSDIAGALTISGLGRTLTDLAPDAGAPASVAALVAASGNGPDGNGQDFDLLLAAVNAAGLTEALANPAASLSVFAPTDAAFVSLAERLGFGGSGEAAALDFILDTLSDLGGGDPIPLLTDVLTFHVAAGARTLGELQADVVIGSLFEDADPRVDQNRVRDQDPDFADPRIVTSDVVTGNGIVQVINEVLLPFDL